MVVHVSRARVGLAAGAALLGLGVLLAPQAEAAPTTGTDPLFCATLTPEAISEFTLDGWTTSIDYPATGAAGATVEVTIDISPAIVNDSAQAVEVAAAVYAVDVQDRWGRVVASASGARQPLAPTTVGVGDAFPAITAATFALPLPGSDTDRSYHLVPSVAYASDSDDLAAISFGFCAPTDNDDYDTPLTSAFPIDVAGTPGTAPRLTLSSTGPFRGGERVVVAGRGFEPLAPIVVLECAKTRVVFEPGDCASGEEPVGATQAAADGTFSTTVTVVTGALGNASPPAETCSAVKACVVTAFGLFTPGQSAAADLVFTAAPATPPGDGDGGDDGGDDPPADQPTPPDQDPDDDAGNDGDGSDPGGAASAPGGELAATGTSPAALLTALALVQLGAVLVVRAGRARTAPVGAHRR